MSLLATVFASSISLPARIKRIHDDNRRSIPVRCVNRSSGLHLHCVWSRQFDDWRRRNAETSRANGQQLTVSRMSQRDVGVETRGVWFSIWCRSCRFVARLLVARKRLAERNLQLKNTTNTSHQSVSSLAQSINRSMVLGFQIDFRQITILGP